MASRYVVHHANLREGTAPILMSPSNLSIPHQRFTRVRLSNHTYRSNSVTFNVMFTIAYFRSEATYGCLKPAPTGRFRRAHRHLEQSIVLVKHVHGTLKRAVGLITDRPLNGVAPRRQHALECSVFPQRTRFTELTAIYKPCLSG